MKFTKVMLVLMIFILASSLALLSCSSDDDSTVDGDTENSDSDTTNADGDQVAADGDQAPADGDQVAADGDQAPADGDEVAADGDQSSATAHPFWSSVAWDSFLPAATETAVYRSTPYGGDPEDLTTKYEYDVDFEGGKWDRIVIGNPVKGSTGVAIYLKSKESWIVEVKGVDSYNKDGSGFSEVFDTPLTFNLKTKLNEKTTYTGKLKMFGEDNPLAVKYEVTFTDYNAEVEVPYGKLTGCMKAEIKVSGEFLGDTVVDVTIYAHPEQRIVSWTDPPGFMSLLLVEAWK